MIIADFRFRSLAITVLISSLFASGCALSEPDTDFQNESTAVSKKPFSPFVSGRVTVLFDEETTLMIEKAEAGVESVATKAPELGLALEGMGVKSLRRVFPYAGKFEERTRREGLHRFYYVEFDDEVPATKAAGDLSSIPGVVKVTPELAVRPRVFNDPYFSSQWHFVNARYKDCDINVQKVWDEFTVGRKEVIVSVVDEGVFMQHKDLEANLIPCLDDGTGSYNFNNDTPRVVPTQGHGTHVAGIISAISNNGIGVAGIAGGDAEKGIPGARVMSCQIFDLYGNRPDIYAAIKHGADNGAVILQCSWGFSPDMDGDGFTTDEEIELYRSYTIDDLPEYKAAIDYFIKYAGCDNNGNQLPDSPMKGGVAIFAAGNDNFDYDPLVSYEPIIAVGAFGGTGNKASYSNYGEWVDIAAPGGDAKMGIYSTLLSNNYGGTDWQGTSMACPHVSGVAALLASHFGGPGFTAEECRERILRGAVSGFFTGSRYIGRKLDAYGAFTFDVNTPIKEPVLSWDGTPPSTLGHIETAEVKFKASDPAGLKLFLSVSPEVPGISLGESAISIDAGKLGLGKHTVTLTAVNEDRASASISMTFQVRDNERPVKASDLPYGILVEAPGSTASESVAGWFTDPDGDPLVWEAVITDSHIAEASVSEDGVLTVKGLSAGLASVTVTASDGDLSDSVEIPVAVKDPSAPICIYPTAASSHISIRTESLEPVAVSIDIYSTTGAKVLSEEKEGDIFHPVPLSIHNLAPGLYTARVSYSGKDVKLRFTKI